MAPGEVVIRVAWSSVNYKDALAGTGKGRILRHFPLVGGIDVAGHVVASTDPTYREGDAVLATGCGLSETRDGGYAQYARLESRAVIALPASLSLREAMIIGTAGYTAALALLRLRENRQQPAMGPLVVTGASGGVGMLALDIFSRAGFEVHAVSGKAERADFLRSIGASEVLRREALHSTRPLEPARYGGGLDNVGGPMLVSLLARDRALWQRRLRRPGGLASAGHDGHAFHLARRLPIGHRLLRQRTRHSRTSVGPPGRRLAATPLGSHLYPRDWPGRPAGDIRRDAGR